MKQSKFIKYAFAENGDVESIDTDASSQGKVSIVEGYTQAYEKDAQAGGEYIRRRNFNYILNYFTKEILALQLNGVNEVNSAILTGGGYPKGGRCIVWQNVQTGALDRNGSTNPLCKSVEVVSMKDNNNTDPYLERALFGDWFLDDGGIIGEIKVVQVNLSAPPAGYLDLAPDSANPDYVKSQYPRIQAILGDSANSTWGFFQSTSATNFTIINPRGRFARVWSNGSTIDNGRAFTDLQGDAIRNIKGGWDGELYRDGQTRYSWRFNKGEVSGGEWSQDYWGAFTKGRVASSIDLYPASVSFSPSYGWAFDASNVVPTTDPQNGENRPYNFNQKMYIKV